EGTRLGAGGGRLGDRRRRARRERSARAAPGDGAARARRLARRHPHDQPGTQRARDLEAEGSALMRDVGWRRLWAAGLLVAAIVFGAPARADDEPPAAPLTTADLKQVPVPSTEDLAKGDPGGTLTGNAGDIVVADSKAGLTFADVVTQVGQNRIAINFVWTLIAGFLVMFMQAGFAIVETGLCRAKNANHTMMMNFMVYGFGLFAFWVCGFAIQMGGGAPYSTLGGASSLNSEHVINFLGKSWGLFGTHGFFLSGITYDVGVMVLFLFQMVFMDTALTIVT